MITVTKQENGVLFTFENSDKYLYGNGTIEVPFNSLSIIMDESDNITLRKSASNDIFLSARYDTDFGYSSKEEAVEALKSILYDEAGISQEEVQDMIDSAMSGVPSSQVVEQLRTDVDTISGNTYTKTQIDGFLNNATTMLTTISGEVQTNSANIQDIYDTIDLKEEVIASALTEVRQDVSDIDEKEEVIASALTSIESAVTAVSNDLNTLSGAVIDNEYTVSQSLNDLNSRLIAVESGGSVDLSQYWTSAQTQSAIDDAKAYYISFATIATTGIRDEDWDGIVAAIDDHRPIYAGYPRNDGGILYYGVECMNKNVSNTQIVLTSSDDSSHYFYTFTKNGSNDYTFTSETRPYTTQAEKDSWNSKQDALVSGTNIKTINNESILGSGNIDIQGGGGKAIEAGRGISITTGETADTVSFNLPISAGTRTNNIKIGGGTSSGQYSLAGGAANPISLSYASFAWGEGAEANVSHSTVFGHYSNGNGRYSFANGEYVNTNNEAEHSQGKYNISNKANDTWGDSGNTLFSVGNGTSSSARHNAFEIRQNGDIYVNDGTNDVRLQDTILALGGLKLVKILQADYDALATKDNDTLYIVPDADGGRSDWEQ